MLSLQSSGELENDEHTAGVIMQMVRTACRFRLNGTSEPPFKRMSGELNGTSQSIFTTRGQFSFFFLNVADYI